MKFRPLSDHTTLNTKSCEKFQQNNKKTANKRPVKSLKLNAIISDIFCFDRSGSMCTIGRAPPCWSVLEQTLKLFCSWGCQTKHCPEVPTISPQGPLSSRSDDITHMIFTSVSSFPCQKTSCDVNENFSFHYELLGCICVVNGWGQVNNVCMLYSGRGHSSCFGLLADK